MATSGAFGKAGSTWFTAAGSAPKGLGSTLFTIGSGTAPTGACTAVKAPIGAFGITGST